MTDTAWFTEARFGLFVHWGLYAIPARRGNNTGTSEWVQRHEHSHTDAYARYLRYFDPDRYDPAAWAEEAWDAGMRYAVLTTKHHDGFCLWDSALTDFKATNTPAGRDLVREFTDAFRSRGFRIGFYHSLIDWHHPEFPVDGKHPMDENEEFKAAASGRDITKYADYLHGQVRELLTGYGRVDVMWFDYSYPEQPGAWGGKGAADWRSEELFATVRELQPRILVNDRLDVPGDFITPEQVQLAGQLKRDGKPVVWEACQTMNGDWGYNRDNLAFKSAGQLVRMLIDTVANGGNLLLNTGPTARGTLEKASVERLRAVGEWMELHERSIRGAGPSTYRPPADARYTQRGDRLYLHLFSWPMRHIHLPGLAGTVEHAQMLQDGSEVLFQDTTTVDGHPDDPALSDEGSLTLHLPENRPETAVPVVELFLRA
ncbi:alpha-L-fucosidase [Streptomyces pathocidini]|uniref:alpha-L-fucosidase n=1 Tax=Streptomyces pathocidini TaxID=1650571 RepID=A0ABW7UMG3_9ACTN|nr:alpha-L-fucosidase [Streptomyces pathocidini]